MAWLSLSTSAVRIGTPLANLSNNSFSKLILFDGNAEEEEEDDDDDLAALYKEATRPVRFWLLEKKLLDELFTICLQLASASSSSVWFKEQVVETIFLSFDIVLFFWFFERENLNYYWIFNFWNINIWRDTINC